MFYEKNREDLYFTRFVDKVSFCQVATAYIYYSKTRLLKRNVVYSGWPIAPPTMSPKCGGLRARQWVQLYTGAQINFGDLTPYLTYKLDVPQPDLKHQGSRLKHRPWPGLHYVYDPITRGANTIIMLQYWLRSIWSGEGDGIEGVGGVLNKPTLF